MNESPAGQTPAQLYIDLMKKVLTASIYAESGWVEVQESGPKSRSLMRPTRFIRSALRDRLIRRFRTRSIALIEKKPLDTPARDEGRDWPLIGYTMTGHRRLDNVQACIEDVLRNRIPGDFIETGVWRGGTTIFMRAVLKAHGILDRKVWVADSFEGLPAPKNDDDGWDHSKVDYLKVSLESVKENFDRFGLLDDQVCFLKGWFSDTLPHAPFNQLAILRLDGDMYSSTMDALQNLYHKVSKGGYVIVDDYYSWPSCRQAVTDFLAAHNVQPDIKQVDWTGAYWKV